MTPDGLVVRRATRGRPRPHRRAARPRRGPGRPPGEDPADLGPYAALREIEERGGAVLVAEVDGEVVGVCQLIVFRHLQARGGRCAEIESVHVHPDHRGAGVGGALLAEAVARARALGCYRVQLTSNVARPDAHRSTSASASCPPTSASSCRSSDERSPGLPSSSNHVIS